MSRRARTDRPVSLLLGLALMLGSTALATSVVAPSVEATDVGACAVDGAAANGITVAPSHGSVFYIDTGQNQQVDAAYVGYRVTSTTARTNLWVTVDDFLGGVVVPADPEATRYRVADLTAGGTKPAYFLLKAPRPTSTAQSHRVTVHDRDPRLTGATVLYQCRFTFVQVRETIKAAANKVRSMSVVKVEQLGGTLTVTVEGQTGTIGSGTSSPDGRVIWFNPAARSAWPAGSLVLESTSVQFSTNSQNFNANQSAGGPFLDVLVFRNPGLAGATPANPLTATGTRFTYRAVYTFRIRGPVPAGVQAIPIAQISSGTQIKHTDVASVTSQAASSVSLATPITVDLKKSVNPAASGGSSIAYVVTATASSESTLDQIVDDYDTSLSYVAGSARWNGAVISDPVTDGSGRLVFQGPFVVPTGAGGRALTYTMSAASCGVGANPSVIDATNRAWALIGSQIVGDGAKLSGVRVTSPTCSTATLTPTDASIDQAPIALTQSATSVASTSATLNGSIHPKGAVRTVTFEWGTDSTLTTATVVALANSSAVDAYQQVSTALTGLSGGTTYYFRVTVGDVKGEIRSFETLPVSADPTVTTGPVTSITAGTGSNGTAELNGSFSANAVTGGATPYFRWGLTDNSGAVANCDTVAYGADTVVREDISETSSPDLQPILLESAFPSDLSLDIGSLQQGKYYCAQAVITWSGGSAVGAAVLFQVVAPVTATITYSTNGGTGAAPSNQTGQTGTPLTLAGQGSLTRTGFVFGGWNTAADGSGTSYAAGSTFVPSTASTTLYATWIALVTITYDGNGATSGSAPASQQVASGAAVTLRTNSGSLVKTGAQFGGWNTAADGSGTNYAAGSQFAPVANITLYARWITGFTITYAATGSTSGSAPGTQSVAVGAGATIGTGNLLRTGWTFAGWSTNPNGTGTLYTAGQANVILDQSLTLHPRWTMQVTYDANGATGGTVPTDATNYGEADTITVSGNTGTLVRDGFVFDGWDTAAAGNGTARAAGSTFAPAGDVTLYARWLTARTVTYDANGATSGTVPAAGIVGDGRDVTVAANTGSLARTGFTFGGWQTGPGGGTVYAAGTGTFTVNANATLYARWIPVPAPAPAPAPEPDPTTETTATPPAPRPPFGPIPGAPQRLPDAPAPTPAPVQPQPPVVRPTPPAAPPTVTPPAPAGPAAPLPTLPGLGTIAPAAPDAAAPAVPGAATTVDVGTGAVAVGPSAPAGVSDLSQGRRTVSELAGEALGGFDPGRGIRIEVLGSRTGARFVLSDVSGIDALALARAIDASVPTQAADFASVREVRPTVAPEPAPAWNDEVRSAVAEFFAAAGLPAPVSLADLDVDVATWIAVRMEGATYLPGSTVYLTVTSSPIVFGTATVTRDGKFSVDGAMPVELLGAGEHRIRIVGIRSLDGISIDGDGQVVLAAETMAEIERFDLGTQATVAVIGSNPTGGGHVALRVVPLVPIAPWWTLWFVLLGLLVGGALKRRDEEATTRVRGIAVGIALASALPAVILGWRSTVTVVVWWGIGLALLAAAVILAIRPRTTEGDEEPAAASAR